MSNEAEAYLIGGVFLKPDTFLEIDLKPTDFLNDNHSQIWAAMLEMKAKSQFVDLATTLDYLDSKFGETHLTRIVITLANETPSAANCFVIAKPIPPLAPVTKAFFIGCLLWFPYPNKSFQIGNSFSSFLRNQSGISRFLNVSMSKQTVTLLPSMAGSACPST